MTPSKGKVLIVDDDVKIIEMLRRTLAYEGYRVITALNGTRIARDIDAQIYARDFKLIDQSDMIVSYIPALPGGRPALSSGVERELQHAFESTKEVYVVWRPDDEPSPFITETATAVFRSLPELFAHFQQRGYVGAYQLPLSKHEA